MSREELHLHTNEWVLRLENESGIIGYFAGIGEGIHIAKELNERAHRFPTEKAAKQCARLLAREYGVDIEEFTPEEIVHEKEYHLSLGPDADADFVSINVDERTGKRYIVVSADGVEVSVDIHDDIGDALQRRS